MTPALFPRPRGLIRVSGRDRVRWLQGMVTQELATLAPGAGCFAAACDRKGKMVGVMIVRAFEDHYLLETEPELVAPLSAHFGKLIIMDDVALEDVSARWAPFEHVGPLAGVPAHPWFHFVPWRGGFASRSRIYGDGMTVFAPAGERLEIAPAIDEAAAEALRIENGFPRWGRDMGPEELPSEANLDPIAVSYTKGCYLGQEVILRVKNFSEPPKRLVLLGIDGPAAPPAGAEVRPGGRVTSAAFSPREGRALALAYVRKEHKSPGTAVQIPLGRVTLSATVLELPWHAFADRPPERPRGDEPPVARLR